MKMKLVEIKKTDFTFEDERGLICQIAHGDFAQVNCVFSRKGAVRGRFHFHKEAAEQFYVASGSVKVQLRLGEQAQEYVFTAGNSFLIPPPVRHNFIYLEDTVLVSMYDKCVEQADGTKDIFNDEEA